MNLDGQNVENDKKTNVSKWPMLEDTLAFQNGETSSKMTERNNIAETNTPEAQVKRVY